MPHPVQPCPTQAHESYEKPQVLLKGEVGRCSLFIAASDIAGVERR